MSMNNLTQTRPQMFKKKQQEFRFQGVILASVAVVLVNAPALLAQSASAVSLESSGPGAWIAAYGEKGIAAYLVWWMTTRHTKALDDLKDVIKENSDAFRMMVVGQERIEQRLHRIEEHQHARHAEEVR